MKPYPINFAYYQVVNYLLDPTRLLSDDQTYEASLRIEPRRNFTEIPQTIPTTKQGDSVERLNEDEYK